MVQLNFLSGPRENKAADEKGKWGRSQIRGSSLAQQREEGKRRD